MKPLFILIITFLSVSAYSDSDNYAYEVRNDGTVKVYVQKPPAYVKEIAFSTKLDSSNDYYIKSEIDYKEYYQRIDTVQIIGQCLLITDGGSGSAAHTGYGKYIDSWNLKTKQHHQSTTSSISDVQKNSDSTWALVLEAGGEKVRLLKRTCEIETLSVLSPGSDWTSINTESIDFENEYRRVTIQSDGRFSESKK